MTHKTWLDNEYAEWVKALQESTVHNFKEHPIVKRMLGEPNALLLPAMPDNLPYSVLFQIDRIGRHKEAGPDLTSAGMRMVFYALEILKRNPSSICEIGGGVGQFYAILRALGYKGEYYIRDLEPVMEFQVKYLREVAKQTGLYLDQELDSSKPFMVISFYALGEFDDETKQKYFYNYINRPKINGNGYIAWNPHSGASDDLSLFKHDIKVSPGIEPGVKIIQW